MPQLELNGKILATQTGSANTIVHADALEHATFAANHAGVKTAINASGTAPIYAVRAWVNFDGTGDFSTNPGTAMINGSGNVTSITGNAVGDYTVNYNTSMQDANYSFISNYTLDSGNNNGSGEVTNKQAGSCRFVCRWPGNSTAYDMEEISVIVCR